MCYDEKKKDVCVLLNREQRKVLSVLNRMKNSPFSEIDFRNKTKIFERARLVLLCKTLDQAGYFDSCEITTTNDIQKIKLSYKGLCYKHDLVFEFLSGCFLWFSDHIVELAALIVAIIALIRTL